VAKAEPKAEVAPVAKVETIAKAPPVAEVKPKAVSPAKAEGEDRPSQLNQIRAAIADTPDAGEAPKPKRTPRKPKAS
jgi:hypothetical protein